MSSPEGPSHHSDEPTSQHSPLRELDEVGAKVIELYQNHASLVDRTWAYFSQYSALLIVFACLLAVYRASPEINSLRWSTLVFPLVIYIVLALGNHRALALTMAELQIIRGIANTRTQYRFSGTSTGTMMRFHLVLIVLVSTWYLTACYISRT